MQLLAQRVDRHWPPRPVPRLELVEHHPVRELPLAGLVEHADQEHPGRHDPLGQVNVHLRRVEVVVVRADAADQWCGRAVTGHPLETDGGGDHILRLLGGHREADRIELPAHEVAFRPQTHFRLHLGARRRALCARGDGTIQTGRCNDHCCDEDRSHGARL